MGKRSMKHKIWVPILIGALTIGLLIGSDDDGPVTAQQAPNWTATTLDHSPISKQSLQGKAYVLDFWSTTCAPCVASIGQENRFVKQIAEKAQVLAITADSDSQLQPFLKNHQLDAKIVMDQKAKAAGQFAIPALPTAIVVDKFGNIVYKQTPPDFATIARVVEGLP